MIYFQSQVDRLVKAKDDQIVDLKSQIVKLNQELDLERKRANTAIDNLLFTAGSTRITPAPAREHTPFTDLLSQVSEGLARVGVLPEEEVVEVKKDA